MFVPIERKKVSSQVLDQLKKMIKEKTFPPESRLPSEHELSKMFGVSRAPIREALSVLSASGLIESRQGGGSYVKRVNLAGMLDPMTFEMVEADQVLELVEMRIIIESEAASLAAIRHTEEELLEIKESLEAFKGTIKNSAEIGYEADYRFHHDIVKAAHNSFLLHTVENLGHLYRKALAYSLTQRPESRKQVHEDHDRIFEAIKNRDAQGAAEAVREHLEHVRMKVMQG
ncbi:FadR family transcriptional regulator [Priestia flexa]|jgi:GntR family transcriptional regulator, transcriptional repressor for pyruvate dehydrogenase complex|uniref:FadR family transcriptional regulator n=2 Tax=Bacillaceae TaxID=186817 RepID=A0A8I1MEY2_9BACI|nr:MULTISPECIES: FadR/GntR family transcriptional regulator [Bacillaceae]OZT12077.1 FadR family transcriptional regulator [Priestia aryabhattai]USY53738.1 FadR family transcriptional regulator [Bacillus sp. 1780r2a1]MBN8251925.1 FadR family transcriptional regulator [Priestia flexa]MBN8435427.1 FadR family transcriptional regulator [Priestia flexa]MCA0967997.1 FadR family transcriptional regulator [Priestia flexa]